MPLPFNKDEINKFYYWREFLLRSSRYKELCDLVKSKEKYPLPIEFENSWCPLNKKQYALYFKWIERAFLLEEIMVPFSRKHNLAIGDVLLGIYPLFQDIYHEPFSKVEHRVTLFYEQYDPCAVLQTIKDKVGTRNFDEMKSFFRIEEEEPPERIRKYYYEYLHNMITEEQMILCLTPALWPYFTAGYKNFSHWQTYLEVLDALDAASGNTSKAFRRLNPTTPTDNGAASSSPKWSTFQKQMKKANDLLTSAEGGTFPGWHAKRKQGNKK